jgi:hypothetical protein
LWLKNKKNYYGAIHREDDARLVMMEERYRKSIESVKSNTKRGSQATPRMASPSPKTVLRLRRVTRW